MKIREEPQFIPMLTHSVALLFALTFACFLFLIPWEFIQGREFPDLKVYLEGFHGGEYDYLDEYEGLKYLFSEPLWRNIIYRLSEVFGDIPFSFKIISFFISTLLSYIILRYKPIFVFLLISPLVIDLIFSQVRSGLMISIFYLGLLGGSSMLWIILFSIAFLIHSAAIIIFSYFAFSILLNLLSNRNRVLSMLLTFAASILIPLGFAAFYSGLLSSVGDRRSELEPAWPGGVFVLGISIYYLLMLINIKKVIGHTIPIFTFLVCGSFLVLAIFEINFLRLIALVFPLLILSAFILPLKARLLVLFGLFAMTIYHFFFWSGLVA